MQPERPNPPISESPNPAPAVAPDEPSSAPDETSPARPGETAPVQWQAPEYIQTPRSPLWFVGFWLCVILLMAIAAFLIKSWSFAILVPAMAAALMIYSHRPPRQLNYVLSGKGLYINDKLHPMNEFRTFGILQEESLPALMLIPMKRFRPGLTVYFPADQGEAIVDLLGARIPMQDLHLDAFDRVVRKLRM
jgi:hypothetical protein